MVDAGFVPQSPRINYISPDTVLQKLEIKPEDITDIILTHPHWDHMGGIHLFPNAMLWMQTDDYNYFVGTAWQPKTLSNSKHLLPFSEAYLYLSENSVKY